MQLEEYYAIRVSRKHGHQPRAIKDDSHDIFITEDNRFGRITRARRFSDIDQAEQYLLTQPLPDAFQYTVQFCVVENRQATDSNISQITARLMEIPHPYRRTAYNWMRGNDVRKLLLSQSDEVYQRHQKVLLDYDIDISKRSDVIMMPKRRRSRKNISYHSQLDNAPRQFFALPSQRPSGKAKK
ncbi:MAG: hypothetical protein HUJ30_01465 [Gammaproteobacteria bacterium]|nr:hypothetical protein [Gammaproteobacteria bacterium]